MSHVQMPENRRKRADRRSSGLYLPAWSVAAMLLIVIAIVVAIVTLLVTLGGNPPASGEPRVVIVTAVPSDTPLPALPTSTPTPLPAVSGGTSIPVPEFALEGPTLPPIVFTPTPLSIAIGVTVRVDADGLNIREAPGLDQTILFQAEQDSLFIIVGGSERASDITWWQIEDPDDPTRSGWAAADYLVAQP